jgi:hypothetical protein
MKESASTFIYLESREVDVEANIANRSEIIIIEK